ncbi:MAG: hypothetical protein E6H78_15630 [Betaproteobacteria bacterium]|nr:MAG: hypothetical protein E6H78_15630 [Betaproteobacteria bacterium]
MFQQVAGTLEEIEGAEIAGGCHRSGAGTSRTFRAGTGCEQLHETVEHLVAHLLIHGQCIGSRCVDASRENRFATDRADDFEQQRSCFTPYPVPTHDPLDLEAVAGLVG